MTLPLFFLHPNAHPRTPSSPQDAVQGDGSLSVAKSHTGLATSGEPVCGWEGWRG